MEESERESLVSAFGRDGFSNFVVKMGAEEDGEWALVSEAGC